MAAATIERGLTNQLIEPNAFRIEHYKESVSDQALIDDIVSYLGEYRFSLPKYSYSFIFKDGKLIDPLRNKSLIEMSQNAVDLKIKEGKSSIREEAETKAFQKLNRELISAKEGQTILWASPAGSKEDGYGDYGFIYFGKVKEENSVKTIKMTAIRVEDPTIEQFNKAISLISFQKTNYKTPEEFLQNPQVLEENISEEYVDSILKMVFSFKLEKEEMKKFEKIIKEMFPLIVDSVKTIKDPWIPKSEKIRVLYTLENYALELQKEIIVYEDKFYPATQLKDLVPYYSYTPPKVAGSCGSTSKNSITSSNVFNKLSSLNSLFSEDEEWFLCPKCNYKADGPIGDTCPGCGLTKEAYAEETGISCE